MLLTAWGANETLWSLLHFVLGGVTGLFLFSFYFVILLIILLFSCTGSTPLRLCKAQVKVSVRSRASRGAVIENPQHSAPDSAQKHRQLRHGCGPHGNKNHRQHTPRLLVFWRVFLWSAQSHLPRFIFPLGHATNLQSGGSVFLSSVVPCSGKSIKNKTPRLIALPQSTVAVPARYSVCLLSSVFLLLDSWQCAFGLRWKSFFKTSGFRREQTPSGHRHTNSIISYVWPLKLTLVVLCHLHSLVCELTLHVSILTLKKKKRCWPETKDVFLLFSFFKLKLGQANFVLVYTQKHQTNQNNWASQHAPFHTFDITLNNIQHCCTLLCVALISAWVALSQIVHCHF